MIGFVLLWQDKVIKKAIISVLFILLLFLGLFAFKFRDLPPQLPLFYSSPRGTDQLGNSVLILILPIFAFIIAIVNFIISYLVYQKDQLVARILMLTGSFISLVLFITFVKIISIIS